MIFLRIHTDARGNAGTDGRNADNIGWRMRRDDHAGIGRRLKGYFTVSFFNLIKRITIDWDI